MFEKTIEQFQNYIGNGFAMVLFLLSVLFLLVKEKDKTKRVLLIYFPMLVLLLFFCPIFSTLIYKALDDETYYRILWLLPMTQVIAYAAVKLILILSHKWQRVVAVILICAAIVLTGNYVYDNPYFSKAENRFHVPQTVADVCDAIIIPGREVRAVMPNEMLPYVRQYSANILMPYGRAVVVEEWDKKSELYDAMSADKIDCERVAKLAKEKECQYIVLHSTWKCIGTLEDYQYQKVKTVDGYDIYLLEGADIKIPQ
jgi:hypothetical protein